MLRHVVTARRLACTTALLAVVALNRPMGAEFDIVASWAVRNTEDISRDSYPVDYLGLPLSDEGRVRALSYNESQLAMVEHQCQGWPPFYFIQGPFGLRIWSDSEPVKGTTVSYTIGAWEDRPAMTIWMDGRPHPSDRALHTREGFTTGRWDGDTLVTYTTHMKAGLLRKNGPPSSDRATLTSYFFRHDDLLTALAIIDDPIYLAEPEILSKTFVLSTAPVAPTGPPCIATYEGRRAGDGVPHYTPEKNPFVDELTTKFHLPREAVLGQPDTMYPEYRKKIKSSYVRPEPCASDCGAVPGR